MLNQDKCDRYTLYMSKLNNVGLLKYDKCALTKNNTPRDIKWLNISEISIEVIKSYAIWKYEILAY